MLDAEGSCETPQKRIKLGDLESVRDQEETGDNEAAHPDVGSVSGALDLNVGTGSISISAPSGFEESNKLLNPEKGVKTRPFSTKLNADNISSSTKDLFHPYKAYERLKSRDESESGSSVDDKNSMNVSTSTHGVTLANAVPKARGRKKSSDDMMKRVALAKKEQADRFAKVAAPSGLLNELNPGIINHVRNKKQVHAIIEALVRSEKTENEQSGSQQRNQMTSGTRELMLERGQSGVHVSLAESSYLKSEKMSGLYDFGDKGASLARRVPSENTVCWSNEEAGNLTYVVDSLSVKAAKVASQWLGLLNEDIKGRLAALKCSKKRVCSVITKELPSMMFSSVDAAHVSKWGTLFRDMDKALSEEEKHLEAWLKQVKEMQLYCVIGLNKSSIHRAQQQDTALLQGCNRSNKAQDSEEDLAIMAAAASMYSTCSYLSSKANLPCC